MRRREAYPSYSQHPPPLPYTHPGGDKSSLSPHVSKYLAVCVQPLETIRNKLLVGVLDRTLLQVLYQFSIRVSQ